MNIGWNFPLNNDGAEVGLNDAGIETFKGFRLKGLSREVTQNSSDARRKGKEPVEIHFDLHEIPSEWFYGREQYIEVLEHCLEYWSSIEKSKLFFRDAINLLRQTHMRVLKISDYNTTGLTGSKLDRGGVWNSLIKAVGVSNKSSNAGGSFGIGKHAPFACSSLRTVFYGTKDENGNTAFQGVGKLATHLHRGFTTQGTGYYGLFHKNKPICEEYYKLNEFYHRDKIGTDIFIMGFNGDKEWENSIIKSVLESFFYAIYEGSLVVKVGKIRIDTNTLPSLIDLYTKGDPKCLSYQYYQAIVNGLKFEVKLKNSDNAELYLLERKGLSKKVAMIRGTGMKIYDKGHFRGLTTFSGVMIAKGHHLNKLLRSIEPPSHDSWQPERNEMDVKLTKKILGELNSWINEKVRSLSDLGSIEQMDVEGMGQYLPDEEKESLANLEEDLSFVPKKVVIEKVIVKQAVEAIKVAVVDEAKSSGDGLGKENEETSERKSKRSKNVRRHGLKRGKNDGKGPAESKGSTLGLNRGIDVKPPLELKGFRSVCVDPKEGIYRISYTASRDGIGYMDVNIVGENGKEEVGIRDAKQLMDNRRVDVKSKNRIGPVILRGNRRDTLVLILDEKIRCALGVDIYED